MDCGHIYLLIKVLNLSKLGYVLFHFDKMAYQSIDSLNIYDQYLVVTKSNRLHF